VSDNPSIRREDLTPEQEQMGIEFYTSGKVDGAREALRKIRAQVEAIEVPHEFEGYLPEGWKQAMTQVWRVVEDLEKLYEDPRNISPGL
jgi:hypothetical protein